MCSLVRGDNGEDDGGDDGNRGARRPRSCLPPYFESVLHLCSLGRSCARKRWLVCQAGAVALRDLCWRGAILLEPWLSHHDMRRRIVAAFPRRARFILQINKHSSQYAGANVAAKLRGKEKSKARQDTLQFTDNVAATFPGLDQLPNHIKHGAIELSGSDIQSRGKATGIAKGGLVDQHTLAFVRTLCCYLIKGTQND